MEQTPGKPSAQLKMDEIVQETLRYNQAIKDGKSSEEINNILVTITTLEKELEEILLGKDQ